MEKITIKVTPKLAKEIRDKHVQAQKRVSEFANEQEEQGSAYSIYSGVEVSCVAFLLYSVLACDMTIEETVDDFMHFITETILRKFVLMPDIKEKAMKELLVDDTYQDKIMAAVSEIMEASGQGFVAAGDTLQEIADQIQDMADAENATKQ